MEIYQLQQNLSITQKLRLKICKIRLSHLNCVWHVIRHRAKIHIKTLCVRSLAGFEARIQRA